MFQMSMIGELVLLKIGENIIFNVNEDGVHRLEPLGNFIEVVDFIDVGVK